MYENEFEIFYAEHDEVISKNERECGVGTAAVKFILKDDRIKL